MLYNHDAERMLLSALLHDNTLIEVGIIQSIEPEDFTKEIHREVFRTVKALANRSVEADCIAVMNELKLQNDAENLAYLAELNGVNHLTSNAEYFAEEVKDMAVRRRTMATCEVMLSRLKQPTEKARDVASDLEKETEAITLSSCGTDYKHIREHLGGTCDELGWITETCGKIRGVEAPYEGLKNFTGFRNGEFTVIAARPGMGKTAFALNLINRIAIRQKIPTGMFSVEMTANQLNMRLISEICQLNNTRLMMGFYRSKRDLEKIGTALHDISQAPFFLDDTGDIKLSDMKTKIRRMVRVNGCKIIFVDYVGIVNAENPRLPRHEQIALVSATLKNLAKKLDVPIVTFSQLTRDSEGKRPNLNSLAETRALEQDAHVVMFIHRERFATPTREEQQEINEKGLPVELIIAKNRNGPTGICPMRFKPTQTTFFDEDTGGSYAEQSQLRGA